MLRFLDLLCTELGAEAARIEFGGRDPDEPRLVWMKLEGGCRLVAVFAAAPEDRALKLQRLQQLAAGFSQTLSDVNLPVPPSVAPESPFKRLDAALEALRSRTGGVDVVIVDVNSPVLWGASESQLHEADVGALVHAGDAVRALLGAGMELDAVCALQGGAFALRELGVSEEQAAVLARVLTERDETARRHHLLTCLAIARARDEAHPTHPSARWAHHETQFGYFVRGFANIYLLVVVFEGAFSELYVESAVVHALPGIEHLLLALPPLDPEPGGERGRVIRLRR